MTKIGKTHFFKKPSIVEKLGEELFLKVPIYKRNQKLNAIYINTDLFKSYISAINTNEEKIYEELESLFQMTILSEQAQQPLSIMGYAYVDRQVDPHCNTINPGSGRSYYFGKHFNLKGEITPFAFAGDGLLNLELGIFETISSNALSNNMPFPPPPILAILLKEDFSSIHYEGGKIKVKNSIIIRVNLNSSLERISHIHYLNKPMDR